MTPAQRTANLKQIARSAVAIEHSHQVPAELAAVTCILESGWLEKAPGNNAFGIKAVAGQPSQRLMTPERFTRKQLDGEIKKGYKAEYVGPVESDGKMKVRIEQDFAVYPDLTACFRAYADLLVDGKYFKARFARYLQHRDVQELLLEMSGSDGLPPYFTGAGYLELFNRIAGQANVKAALVEARTALS